MIAKPVPSQTTDLTMVLMSVVSTMEDKIGIDALFWRLDQDWQQLPAQGKSVHLCNLVELGQRRWVDLP